MSANKFIAVVVAFLILTIVYCVPAKAAESTDYTKLSGDIVTDKGSYNKGESILVTYRIRNSGASALYLQSTGSYDAAFFAKQVNSKGSATALMPLTDVEAAVGVTNKGYRVLVNGNAERDIVYAVVPTNVIGAGMFTFIVTFKINDPSLTQTFSGSAEKTIIVNP